MRRRARIFDPKEHGGAPWQKPVDDARIRAERKRLLEELARLQENGDPAGLLEKAETLLTRMWSGSSWQGRTYLLQGAQWLMRLASQGAARAARAL